MEKPQIIQVSLNSTSIFPRAIVEAKLSVTPNQMDILAILLAEIGKDNDIDSNLDYFITAQEYAKLKGYTDKKEAYRVLKEKVCGEPVSHKTSMRHIGFDMWLGGDSFEQYNWFSHVKYDNGNTYFTLTPQIKQFLVALKKTDEFKVFAKLKYLLPMKSQYSKRLYLMCREFLSSGERFCDTDWDLFLEKLDIPKNYSYAKVKERVLDKAKDEVNEFSDIVIDYKIKEKNVRGGKKPISISFKIFKKEVDYIGLPAE